MSDRHTPRNSLIHIKRDRSEETLDLAPYPGSQYAFNCHSHWSPYSSCSPYVTTTSLNRPLSFLGLDVRDAKDAHIVLEAVRLNMLPLIRRRLTASEREQLVSGNVFVWEEAENDGGLLRWTDGRRWLVSSSYFLSIDILCKSITRSQSRMRGDYLFYEEKMETTQEEKDAKAALRYLSL